MFKILKSLDPLRVQSLTSSNGFARGWADVFPVFKIGVELSDDISPKSENRKKRKREVILEVLRCQKPGKNKVKIARFCMFGLYCVVKNKGGGLKICTLFLFYSQM
jgi:hypothetical protein